MKTGRIINGNNWPLQPRGADISYTASSKLTYLQSSEVHLNTFYTCWHLSCVCPQLGLWGKSSAKLIKNLAQLLHWSILSLRCSLLFPTGESQCFHLISGALILLQDLMFHWVTDREGLKSSAGAAYCRLREFIDHHRHNISGGDLARRQGGGNIHPRPKNKLLGRSFGEWNIPIYSILLMDFHRLQTHTFYVIRWISAGMMSWLIDELTDWTEAVSATILIIK